MPKKKRPPKSPYKQGIYTPINSKKFIGEKAVYRSGYELKFFRWCDSNPNVLEWGSENIIVPYLNPNNDRVSRYFVDNYVKIKEGNSVKKYIIEIKPFKHTKPPNAKRYKNVNSLLYEQAMWRQNQAKWEAAKEWAKKHDCDFIILTEKELFNK